MDTKLVSAEKHCMMTVHKLSCTYDPSEERYLSIQKTDIKTLDLSGSMINEEVRSSVREYRNLEELSLSNCRIKRLENGTFADLQKLIKLNLSDNLLTIFNGYSFGKMTSLNIMILSNNLLESLSEMHLDAYPKLRVLDISGNQLQSLPEDIMYKIQNDPVFTLYAGNNPWNCNSIIWKDSLDRNKEFKKKFCSPIVHSFLGILKDGEGRKIMKKAVGTETEVHHLLRQERIALGVEETELKSKK